MSLDLFQSRTVLQVRNLIRKRPLQRREAGMGINKTHRAFQNILKKQRNLFPNAKNNSFMCHSSRVRVKVVRLQAGDSARVHLFSLVPVPPTRAQGTSLMRESDVTSGLNTPHLTEIYNNHVTVKDALLILKGPLSNNLSQL